MPCIDYGPNGTNTDECGSNRANEYSPRDEVSEDAAVSATKLNPREHATQDELFPESWVTGQ